MKCLFLDAGHGFGPTGAVDDGAVGMNTTERAEVVALAVQLLPILAALPLRVIPIGVTERLSLATKVKQVNACCLQNGWKSGDALLVSLHMNSGAPIARGLEGWYGTGKASGRALADILVNTLAETTGLPLRSKPLLPSNLDRLGRLAILDDTIPTACLLELGFVTNARDVLAMQARSSFVEGIRDGLLHYIGLPMDFFLDVPAGSWYHDAVVHGLQSGLFEMPADGLFHPDQNVSRAELAVALDRLSRILKP